MKLTQICMFFSNLGSFFFLTEQCKDEAKDDICMKTSNSITSVNVFRRILRIFHLI